MDYLVTKSGHNMYEMSSMVQKAIRRGLVEDASYSANELSSKFRTYLWKRLLTTSAEDCWGYTTGYVYDLMRNDKGNGRSALEKAVSFLCASRKSRDADYFACNLLNSRDRRPLSSIEPTLSDVCEVQCPTKNGHSMFDVSSAMFYAIKNGDADGAGYAANELMVRYRKFMWQTLYKAVAEVGDRSLRNEVEALKAVDLSQVGDKNETGIYVAKAITITIRRFKGEEGMEEPKDFHVEDMAQYDTGFMQVPDYVFDCHTIKGKKMGRTKRQFVVVEDRSLRPRVAGMFDGLSWERFFKLSEIGFFDKDNITPRPDKSRMKELDKGILQLNLFDEI